MSEMSDLRERRSALVREMAELDAWLSAANGRTLTGHLKWKEWQRERAEKKYRRGQLMIEVMEVNQLIANLSERGDRWLRGELYNGVVELEERGVDIGDRLRAALRAFEGDG